MNEGSKPDRDRPMSYDFFLLVSINAIWGGTDVVAKYALMDMSPPAVAWTRFTIALLAFAPALWMRRREIPRSLAGLLPFAALGLCGFFGNFTLHYYGLRLSAATHATALRISEALVIVLLSALILREKVSRRAALGLGAGILGVVVVLDIKAGQLGLFRSGYRLGDLIILAGICVEGLYTIIGKRVLKGARPLTATALACAFGWLMLSIVFGPSIALDLAANPPSGRALLACAYLGLLATALGYWTWNRVLSRRDSHRVGITIMVQPMVGIPLAALIFHETVTPLFAAGAILIAMGVYLAGSASSGKSEAA
jgi:drug/metabolite transporter (DMT)-like permease